MLLGVSLLLLPLLAVGTFGCSLQEPTTQTFSQFKINATKTWVQQFVYDVPELTMLGCLTLHQTPGASDNQMNLHGYFSRVPFLPVSCVATLTGNRMDKDCNLIWRSISEPYNVEYADADIIIDHYCYLGHEVAQVFTAERNPSAEVLERVQNVLNQTATVDPSKFVKAWC